MENKYLVLTWSSDIPIGYYGTQKDWNETLVSTINQINYTIVQETSISSTLTTNSSNSELLESIDDLNKYYNITYDNSSLENIILVGNNIMYGSIIVE